MLVAVDSPASAFDLRDKLIRSVLQPSAIDFVNLLAAAELGHKKAVMAIEFGGNEAVIERSRREVQQWAEAVEPSPDDAQRIWNRIRNFTPRFLEKARSGAMVRISTTLAGMREVVQSLNGPVIARAGSGVIYAYFSLASTAAKWMAANPKWHSVIEYAPAAEKENLALWPSPGNDIEIMKRVKEMFDPQKLLNRGRYYRLF